MDRLVACVVVAGISFAAAGRAEVETVSTDPGSGITIEAEGWAGLNSRPTGRDVGLIPVTVTISNASGVDRVWTVATDDRFGRWTGVAPSARIAVPAGATGKTTLFVGMADRWGGHHQLQISGHGVQGSIYLDCRTEEQGHGGAASPALLRAGVSTEVQAIQGYPFEDLQRSGNPLDMAQAPEDWRGWSVFRNVMLSEGEWRALAGGRRKAMLDWVATGGQAAVIVADAAAERLDGMGLPAAGPDGRRRIGAGEVVVIRSQGTGLDAKGWGPFQANGRETFASLLASYQPASSSSRDYAGDGGSWDRGFGRLVEVFGSRTLPVGWILGFLTLFGIIAGPLNVMVLAGAGRRSRMFWTTPLISLAATAFLLALMFLRDGVGGAGARRVLALLVPEHNAVAIIQEQFSRTGVLLGSSFPIEEPAWLQPIGRSDQNAQLSEVDGRMRQGDWFRSRSDQAFIATAVRPSRARIEVVGGSEAAPPAVISSIEVPLERVFVIDEEGRYWTAADVGTGEKKQLVASDADAYARWFESLVVDAGPVRAQALTRVRKVRGYAYATSKDASKLAVRTLGSIRWVDERADFAGPFTRSKP